LEEDFEDNKSLPSSSVYYYTSSNPNGEVISQGLGLPLPDAFLSKGLPVPNEPALPVPDALASSKDAGITGAKELVKNEA